ncbi:MAG: hypothetical protein PF450_04295 [Bacteroidales bacterium]|jgi:hypothetical protein|nr:hypothetical protein [Bacteroidales bacterium]
MDEKQYSIKIDHANKLIRYKHLGPIKKEDIGLAWEEFMGIEEFTTGNYNLLSDYSEGVFIASIKDVDLICDLLTPLKIILDGKKQAMIHRSPLNTALSMLFVEEVYKRVGFIVKIFSTEKAAVQWLTV